MSARTWSVQQDAIFAFFVGADGHLIVRARAGTGKTTTIVEAVQRYAAAFPGRRIVVCAFNKRIADELVSRFVGFPGVEVKTLHALGFAAVRRFWEGIRIEGKDEKGLRAKGLTERACGNRVPDAIKKLVTRLHTLGRETMPHATFPSSLPAMVDLAQRFECDPDEEWEAEGWTTEFVAEKALAAMQLAEARPPFIDFADMIFLPLRHGWLRKWADLVVVDEAQDMTVAQLEVAQGICRGRIAVVGDDRQAIYGFRGADAESLDRLKAELGAEELGLTVTYRCGRAIVARAARLVPDFTAGPDNPEGEVLALPESKLVDAAALGDFVLSRTNAPLVSTAMALLRAGKRTRVAGRDLGASLTTLVRKLGRTARSVPDFLELLAGWQEREVSRITRGTKNEEAAARRIEEVADRADMIRNLADDAKNVQEIQDRIEALFTDDGLGQAGVITCSSVHRAKGLEADRVFVLADTLRDHNVEEQNIRYVAITRAKSRLTFVRAASAGLAQDLEQEAAGAR